jgi:membrane fusion protein, multidrug efflux system
MRNNYGKHDKQVHLFKPAFLAVIVPLSILALQSCSKKSSGMYSQRTAVPVVAATAVKETVPIQISTIGNVEAYSTVSIKALVGGELKQVYFKEGQFVDRGARLFLIDPGPYEAALEQAKANLQRDRAQFENAEQDVNRYESLAKKDYVTQEQYEQIKTNAEALSATVMADDAMVKNAQLQLGYCSINAPISGRTGDLLIKTGNIVKANDTSPLVTIQQIKPIYVTFSLPEQYVSDIREYSQHKRLKVSVFSSSLSIAAPVTGTGKTDVLPTPRAGELTFMDNTVDTATGTILLKGTFQNNREILWPGESLNVLLTLTEREDAVVIPTQAVQTGQMGQYVFVIKPDRTVDMRTVSVNYSYGSESIVDSGLNAGEQVVTDGQMRLVPGSHVAIQTGPGAAEKTAQ